MFDIDKVKIDIDCPKCNFMNLVTFKQVRVRDVIICRGCKANIQLEDHMNTVKKSVREIRRAIRELGEQMSKLGKITLRF